MISPEHPCVIRAQQMLPASARAHAWIGGSAASDLWHYAEPDGGDVDVWLAPITSIHPADMASFYRVCNYARRENDNYDATILHVEPVQSAVGTTRLQILESPKSMVDLVMGFDISVHAFAVPLDHIQPAMRILHPRATSDRIEILNWDNPAVTLGRWFKFQRRYQDMLMTRLLIRAAQDPSVLRCARAIWKSKLTEDLDIPIGL